MILERDTIRRIRGRCERVNWGDVHRLEVNGAVNPLGEHLPPKASRREPGVYGAIHPHQSRSLPAQSGRQERPTGWTGPEKASRIRPTGCYGRAGNTPEGAEAPT